MAERSMKISDLERLKQEGKIRGYSGDTSKLSSPKKSKYGNQKVEFGGHTFDSIKESKRFMLLRARLMNHEIMDLELQKEFVLEVNGEKVASYFADFCYWENRKLIVEDVKSAMTRRLPVYRLKKKLMKSIHGIEIVEV